MNDICSLKDVYKVLYNFEKSFALAHEITINEGMLLCCMKDGKAKTANEICEFIGLSNSRVSRIINTVEKKEFIKREIGNADKRQMLFTLTDEGNAKIKEMLKQDTGMEDLKRKISELIKL